MLFVFEIIILFYTYKSIIFYDYYIDRVIHYSSTGKAVETCCLTHMSIFFKKTIKLKQQNDTECVSCTIRAYNILNDKVTYFLR